MDYKKDIKDRAVVGRNDKGEIETLSITLQKKCERLATAVYLVTNFLLDTEPLKYRLRSLSVDSVRDASFIKNGNSISEANVLDALRANIMETLSLLELAFTAGLVSEMNFAILKREYASVRDMVDIKKVSRESQSDTILGENFFSHTNPAPGLRSGSDTKNLGGSFGLYKPAIETTHKGHSIGQSNVSMSDRNTKGQNYSLSPVALPTQKVSSPTSNVSNLKEIKSPSVRAITDVAKESRRVRILKLIKDNREVTIKDIATHFPDLSEKTIQRELVSFVEGGVLKKSGERRWSRYTLA